MTDPFIRRYERAALGACLLMTLGAALWPGGPRAALSVAGGGLLAAVSYRALKGFVGALGEGGRGRRSALVKFFTRHVILALGAYVMLARLRLHPVGVMAGASCLVVAAAALAAGRPRGPVSRSDSLQ